MGLGFSFQFESRHLIIYLDDNFYGHGLILDEFMLLDLANSSFNANSSISYIASNYDDISTSWHAILGCIRKKRMSRLAREGLLGQLDRISRPTCEHCLVGKGHLFHCN